MKGKSRLDFVWFFHPLLVWAACTSVGDVPESFCFPSSSSEFSFSFLFCLWHVMIGGELVFWSCMWLTQPLWWGFQQASSPQLFHIIMLQWVRIEACYHPSASPGSSEHFLSWAKAIIIRREKYNHYCKPRTL
ncbi:hypothetical protein BDV26DRAFT_260772 [Aspergillus bertholletiae]|uniref:Secreted protein n=1 Tax=Aspergillus bertholletiae TaxID=1226010 RepID=A0A5N7BAV1_9EURO|nr:hypothetical protein BDV26DRAFT_260772 [Aspergillus bertholletiae]